MNSLTIRIEPQLPVHEQQQIIHALVGYNDSQVAPENHRSVIVVAREGTRIVGGLLGYTHWNWLFIRHLWVDEEFRRRGVGRHLVHAAEGVASMRGCLHAHCDTFSFQALPFYENLGYHIFGHLKDYPPGHTRYFLQKLQLREHHTA